MDSKIFINYRRENSPWDSLALYQELIKYFPKENIFKDFNTIEPGTDFVDTIEEALESCDVLLVLISEHWLEMKDKNGNLRINNPDDFVRIEIATALKRNIIVIPVLFDKAVLPQAAELPDDLKKLSRRQFIEIDKTRFEADTSKLVNTIKNILAKTAIKTSPSVVKAEVTKPVVSAKTVDVEKPKSGDRKWLVPVVISSIILLLSVIFFVARQINRQKDSAATDSAVMDSVDVNERLRTASQQAQRDSITKINIRKPHSSTHPGKSQVNIDKKALPFGTYENFSAAYRAVFKEAALDFSNIKGDPFSNNTATIQNYKPKITILDNSAQPSNIFQRNNEWAFRFVIEGPQEDETRIQEIDKLIKDVYDESGLKCQRTQIASARSDMLPSYAYRSTHYRVDFYRWQFGKGYNYEVIIYHGT